MNSGEEGVTRSKNVLQVITCKAAVCWGHEEPLVMEDIEVDPPSLGEIRVKMLCASLCHTDLLCQKSLPIPLFPRVLGHEGVGVVESVGKGVTDFKEGDMVIPTYVGECKECDNCKSRKTNICEKHPITLHGLMPDGTSRMSCKGQKLYHLFTCSTFSQYNVINTNYVVKIDPSLPLPHASLLSCGYTTGYGAAWKVAEVGKGSTVAVFGLGGVGLGVVNGAQSMGATKIICVDLNGKKKEKAKIFGMTEFVNPREYEKPVSEVIKEMTGGKGVDYSFECTGVPGVLNEALESTRKGLGVTVLIGAGEQMTLPVNLLSLLNGATLKGCFFGGIQPHSDLPVIIGKCVTKELQLDALVTHEIKFEEMNRAFELLKQPDCLKVIIHMN
ncbi:8-hydroxygeraniol oxidoreductase-like [Tasmannia lanceolata]|uniref:8-hydroxygeraniol oxidoreductase-like n=1 Tax=Tasmannia lanceolata TaxID=3420 RepID=UPI0040630558